MPATGFLNASLPIQRFIYDIGYHTPEFEIIPAVRKAAMMNSTIRETTAEVFQDGPGKLRKLKVSYYPQQCDVVSTEPLTSMCGTGEQLAPVQNYYEITKLLRSKKYTLTTDDLRYVDGEFTISDHGATQIASIFGALQKELAIQITTDIVAHKGLHLDGTEFGQRVTAANTTNGLLTPMGFWQIQKEQTDAAYVNTFYVGSTEVYYWRQSYKLATDNTTLGQDFRKIAIDNLYYDINLNAIMGVTPDSGEYILTFTPEALKFVAWNRNAGLWATDIQNFRAAFDRLSRAGNQNVVRGVFMDTRYGIMWDFYMTYDPCDVYSGTYTWWFELNWDILYTPVQACNPQGVNGIMMYTTCPVVVPNCPTGTALSPAADLETFQWNPSITYPYTVYNLLLNGQQSYPGVAVANDAALVDLLNESISGGIVFSLNGSNIEYEGYSAISGAYNGTSFSFS